MAKNLSPPTFQVQDTGNPLFPEVEHTPPNNTLLKLVKRPQGESENNYNTLLNVTDKDLFDLGFEARILRKRLFMEMEQQQWKKDYVKFLKETDEILAPLSEGATAFTHGMPIPGADALAFQSTILPDDDLYKPASEMPIVCPVDNTKTRVPMSKWDGLARQLSINNRIVEGLQDTLHFQCGLLQSLPSDALTESEHCQLEQLIRNRDVPSEFKQLHKASTKEVGKRMDDLALGGKKKI